VRLGLSPQSHYTIPIFLLFLLNNLHNSVDFVRKMCYIGKVKNNNRSLSERGFKMGANYNKLFKLLIDKKMKKGELCKRIGISGTTLSKMARGENVTVDILIRICRVLDCKIDDILEIEPNE
jgi:DNA-binding Xre family transcriptional regulator